MDGALQRLRVLHGEPGGNVEAYLAGALVLAEDPVDGEDAEVVVGVELGTEALRRKDRPERHACRAPGPARRRVVRRARIRIRSTALTTSGLW